MRARQHLEQRLDSPPLHAIRFLKPSVWLQQQVRFYCQREVRLDSTAAIVHPILARAAPMMAFVFGDRFKVHACASGVGTPAYGGVVVGLQTHRRVDLVMRGTFDEFSIFYQPSGLNRLFGIPMDELTNHHYEARAVFGISMSRLERSLSACGSFEERAQLADRWLLDRVGALSSDRVAICASEIVRRRGNISVFASAQDAKMSVRQFERRFLKQVGMGPKLFARIARFEAALDNKARSLTKSWGDVAHEFGYHDQMHLVHDFREFSGETPTTALTHVESSYRAQIEAARCGRTPAALQDDSRLIM